MNRISLYYSLTGIVIFFIGFFFLNHSDLHSMDFIGKNGLNQVKFEPHNKKISYMMTIDGQSRTVIYRIRGSRSKPTIGLEVLRPGARSLRISEVGNNTSLGEDWDQLSVEAVGKNWFAHEVFGYGAMQEPQSEALQIPWGAIPDLIGALGNIKIKGCKHTVNCTCPNGMTASAKCPCRKGAGCEQADTEIILETPEGSTTSTTTSCMAICR